MNKIKIYHSAGDEEYSNFITNRQLVNSVEEADLVFFEGGADVNPSFYSEPESPHTSTQRSHDKLDIATYEKARSMGKKMFGTCRGLQFLTAMAGGKLIQHMSHPNKHSVFLSGDKKGFLVNSLHHQMAFPFTMPKEDYEILAYAKHLSPIHLGGKFEELKCEEGMEIESLYFPKINALGVQWHPEMMWGSRQLNPDMFKWINQQFFDKLGLTIG